MTPSNLTVFFEDDGDHAWAPIRHMARLAAEVFNAKFVNLEYPQKRNLGTLSSAFSSPKVGGDTGALFIARCPRELRQLITLPVFRQPYQFRALWIIDSFWIQRFPQSRSQAPMVAFKHGSDLARGILEPFDAVAYTRHGDAPYYEEKVGSRALHLGWGSDVLGCGHSDQDRKWDILRIGRQPDEWDNDDQVSELCKQYGLVFHGRPPRTADQLPDYQSLLANWYGKSKFVIAHSNLACPAPYTHPTKEYITGRWTDAAAAGATLAGRQPLSDLSALGWSENAYLNFESSNIHDNLAQIKSAVKTWTPYTARRNYLHALENLDWRWRFEKLANRLGISSPSLANELDTLKSAISSSRSVGNQPA